MIKIVSSLKSFLEREGKIDVFLKNARKVRNARFFSRNYIFYSLAGSFSWKKSEEGVLFWQNLHHKYEKEEGYKNLCKPWEDHQELKTDILV